VVTGLSNLCLGVVRLFDRSASFEAGRKNSKLPEADVSNQNLKIAKEWLTGDRYCTCGVFRKAKTQGAQSLRCC